MSRQVLNFRGKVDTKMNMHLNPTLYREEYCSKAIEILSEGKSITSLAANLGVCRDTIYNWRDSHPAFAKALKCGVEASQAFWEEEGMKGIFGKIPSFQGSPWIFVMKTRFHRDYSEQKEQKSVNDSIVEQLLLGKKIAD